MLAFARSMHLLLLMALLAARGPPGRRGLSEERGPARSCRAPTCMRSPTSSAAQFPGGRRRYLRGTPGALRPWPAALAAKRDRQARAPAWPSLVKAAAARKPIAPPESIDLTEPGTTPSFAKDKGACRFARLRVSAAGRSEGADRPWWNSPITNVPSCATVARKKPLRDLVRALPSKVPPLLQVFSASHASPRADSPPRAAEFPARQKGRFLAPERPALRQPGGYSRRRPR